MCRSGERRRQGIFSSGVRLCRLLLSMLLTFRAHAAEEINQATARLIEREAEEPDGASDEAGITPARGLELRPLIRIGEDQIGDEAMVQRALRLILAADIGDIARRFDVADDERQGFEIGAAIGAEADLAERSNLHRIEML